MPRRRPAQLRVDGRSRARRWDTPPPPRIRGLSHHTTWAIARYEWLSPDYDIFSMATDAALRRYRDFITPPGTRPRYPYGDDCGCRGCSLRDVRHARDVLATVLRNLNPQDRAELAGLVAALDTRYRARTLPDPHADPRRPWWHRRLPGCPFTQSGLI